MEFAFTLIEFIFMAALYMLPVIIAVSRRHKNTLAISVCCIVGAWTGVLWLVALVWSFTNDVNK